MLAEAVAVGAGAGGVILHDNDARVPVDNNAGENAMRLIALEKSRIKGSEPFILWRYR